MWKPDSSEVEGETKPLLLNSQDEKTSSLGTPANPDAREGRGSEVPSSWVTKLLSPWVKDDATNMIACGNLRFESFGNLDATELFLRAHFEYDNHVQDQLLEIKNRKGDNKNPRVLIRCKADAGGPLSHVGIASFSDKIIGYILELNRVGNDKNIEAAREAITTIATVTGEQELSPMKPKIGWREGIPEKLCNGDKVSCERLEAYLSNCPEDVEVADALHYLASPRAKVKMVVSNDPKGGEDIFQTLGDWKDALHVNVSEPHRDATKKFLMEYVNHRRLEKGLSPRFETNSSAAHSEQREEVGGYFVGRNRDAVTWQPIHAGEKVTMQLVSGQEQAPRYREIRIREHCSPEQSSMEKTDQGGVASDERAWINLYPGEDEYGSTWGNSLYDGLRSHKQASRPKPEQQRNFWRGNQATLSSDLDKAIAQGCAFTVDFTHYSTQNQSYRLTIDAPPRATQSNARQLLHEAALVAKSTTASLAAAVVNVPRALAGVTSTAQEKGKQVIGQGR